MLSLRQQRGEIIVYEDTRKCWYDDHRCLGAQANSIYSSSKVWHRVADWVAGFGEVMSSSVPVLIENTHYAPAET